MMLWLFTCVAMCRYLGRQATVMQKNWRGFLARAYFRQLVKKNVLVMTMNWYNEKATQIQKTWRGFYVRKYISNYYSRQRYLRSLQAKNEVISELKELEDRMRAVPFKAYRARRGRLTNPAWLDYNKYLPTRLPPLPPTQPQGPFRPGGQVQRLKCRAAQPSLRMASDYYGLQKARTVMKAQEFQPFSRYRQPYIPMIHSQHPHGLPDYGGTRFRDELPDKHVSTTAFKSQVRSVPTFDKVKDPYSWHQV
ncbi:hypothetical protein ACOMHN_067789 [Nucella lapillus]